MTTFLIFVPSLIVLTMAIYGVYSGRKVVKGLASTIQGEKIFATPAEQRKPDAIPPIPEEGVEVMGGQVLIKALDDLVSFAEEVKPDWILGVHAGGRILSSEVARMLDIPHARCKYVYTERGASAGFRVDELSEPLTGRVLVIDDVVRSGATMTALRDYLLEQNGSELFKMEKVYFGVLVVVAPANGTTFVPDWVSFKVNSFYYSMPWSEFTLKVRTAFELKARGYTDYDRRVLQDYAFMRQSLEYTKDLFKRFVVDDGGKPLPRGHQP